MTPLEVIRAIGEPLTALAAIIAAIKSWLADRKSAEAKRLVSEIKAMLIQEQNQRQTQQITNVINVRTGSETKGSARSGEPLTFSQGEEQPK